VRLNRPASVASGDKLRAWRAKIVGGQKRGIEMKKM